MAADRQRLAQALAAEAARRKMFESIPEAAGQGLPQAPERPMGWNDYLENLSIGLGRGAVKNLEGIKGMVTSPVETLKGVATGVTEAVRNPRMVAEALKQTGQRAMSGPLGLGEVIGENVNMMRVPGKPVMHELDVYHGTPHRFPATEANPLGEFDASKIGTGEGAQAYGHGVYYAENPEVAKGYQPRDPKAEAKLMNLYKQAEARENYNAMEVLESAMLHRTTDELLEQYPRQKSLISRIGKINEKAAGALYKADLPDEMIDRMLDWDKPLSEQPAVFKQLMKVTDLTGTAGFLAKSPETTTFGELYNALKNQNPQSDVSEYFRKGGIPGIKYLDAGSRGQGGTGTRNFVVFPGEEKKVRILERK